MFRRFLPGFAIILAFATAAAAQTDWKGFYAGGNLGVALERASANTSTVFSPTGYFATTSVPAIATVGTQRQRSTGITGGGQVGYNAQSGKWVYGVEADFGLMRLNGASTGTGVYPCCAPTNFTVTQSVKTRWLFTARPRVGYTHGNALFYATAGAAVSNINYQARFTDTFATAAESGGKKVTKGGWVAGGGIEYQMPNNKHWSVKGEYLYTDLGNLGTTSTNLTAFTPPIAFPTNVFTHTAQLHAHIVRGGINYRW